MRALTKLELSKVSGAEYSVSGECLVAMNGFWVFMLVAPEFGMEATSSIYNQISANLLAECEKSCGSDIYAYIPISFFAMTEVLATYSDL